MRKVIYLHEARIAAHLTGLAESVEDLSEVMNQTVERTQQRLAFIEDLIEAITDPAIGQRLAEQREQLLISLNDAKAALEIHLANMKKLSED